MMERQPPPSDVTRPVTPHAPALRPPAWGLGGGRADPGVGA